MKLSDRIRDEADDIGRHKCFTPEELRVIVSSVKRLEDENELLHQALHEMTEARDFNAREIVRLTKQVEVD